MLIDIHVHEKSYSSDSYISLVEIVEKSKEIGLDGVCITDHDSIGLKKEADELSQETGFLIITGAEVLTYEGDLLVFGLDDLPEKKMPAQELIDLVNKYNGAAISAHPYRKNNRGIGDNNKLLKDLSGIEAFSGNTPLNDNLKGLKLAKELGLPALGGSDAHHIKQVGCCVTYFQEEIKSERDFIDAIKNANTSIMFKENYYSTKGQVGLT